MSTLTWSTKLIDFLENELHGDQQYFSESPYYDKIPGVRKADLNFEYTEEEKASFSDIPSIVKRNLKAHVTGKIANVQLRKYQEEILDSFNNERFNLVLNSRQSGITLVTAVHVLTYVMSNRGCNVLMVAPRMDSGCEFLEKLKLIYISMPFYLKPGVVAWNKHSIKFDNGCSIKVMSGKSSGVGYAVDNLVMQDAAHIPPSFSEHIYTGLIPTISANAKGKVTIYSTPNGVNKFYDLYATENVYHKHTVKWSDVPGRDEHWKNNEIRNLGSKEAFAQEYEGKFVHKYEGPTISVEMPTIEELQKRIEELEKTVKELTSKS